MDGWITKPLGAITQLMTKGIAPTYVDYEGTDVVHVLNQKCNRNFEISYSEARLHSLAGKSVPNERFLQPGDVLINSTGVGTAGRVAQIWDVPFQTTMDGHMILLRPGESIDKKYYGYAVKLNQKKIETLAEGSTGQTEINRKRLSDEVLISYPIEKNKQQMISNFLWNIDKKISNNRTINDNLAA